MKISRLYAGLALLWIFLAACQPLNLDAVNNPAPTEQPASLETQPSADQALPTSSRPIYEPGELVDYQAQSGDNLPALAAHFNTTVDEILKANPFIPATATTLPAGMPMKIPIYYMPFWGSSYQIIPDSLFINGPAQVGFNTEEFVSNYSGWLNQYTGYASNETRSGAQIVDLVAQNFSVSPRLLLALLEYQTHSFD